MSRCQKDADDAVENIGVGCLKWFKVNDLVPVDAMYHVRMQSMIDEGQDG